MVVLGSLRFYRFFPQFSKVKVLAFTSIEVCRYSITFDHCSVAAGISIAEGAQDTSPDPTSFHIRLV